MHVSTTAVDLMNILTMLLSEYDNYFILFQISWNGCVNLCYCKRKEDTRLKGIIYVSFVNSEGIDRSSGAGAMKLASSLAKALEGAIPILEAAKVNYTHLAFQEAPIASLSYTDPQHSCLNSLNDQLSLRWKVPETTKTLFILGADKAGTTFLYSLLNSHPGFIGARCDES